MMCVCTSANEAMKGSASIGVSQTVARLVFLLVAHVKLSRAPQDIHSLIRPQYAMGKLTLFAILCAILAIIRVSSPVNQKQEPWIRVAYTAKVTALGLAEYVSQMTAKSWKLTRNLQPGAPGHTAQYVSLNVRMDGMWLEAEHIDVLFPDGLKVQDTVAKILATLQEVACLIMLKR